MHEIADQLWQLAGFPPHAINIYLAGDVLIDAGTRHSRRRVFRHIEGRPLSLVALTHCHADHQGLAKAVCEARGIPLACHSADVAAMEGVEPLQPPSWAIRMFAKLWAGPPYPVARPLSDGDTIAGFRVIHAPGHTPGHVIYFRESDRVAIAGDVLNNMNLLTGIPGLHEPPHVFTTDPAENRRSIRLLASLEPKLVCFGHGPPLRDTSRLREFADQLH